MINVRHRVLVVAIPVFLMVFVPGQIGESAFSGSIGGITVKQQDYRAANYPETTAWSPVDSASDTVVDGNPIEVEVIILTEADSPLNATLSIRDASTPDRVVASEDLTVGSGQMIPKRFIVSTGGYAWRDDGTPRDVWRLAVTLESADGDLLDQQSIEIKVVPRPFVLVHGYNDDHNYWRDHLERTTLQTRVDLVDMLLEIHPDWRGYPLGDGQVEGSIFLGDISRPFLPTDTLQSAGEKLATYIENVRHDANAWQVDIAGHSTGGLVVRSYIHRHMGAAPTNGTRVINRALFFAVPHGGAECADLLHNAIGDITYMYPIRLQLQTQYVTQIFNRLDGLNQRDVPYVLIRGTEVNFAMKTCLLEPDGIVTRASAWGRTPNNPVRGVVDEVAASHYHVADSDHFLEMAQKYLALGPDEYAAMMSPVGVAETSPQGGQQHPAKPTFLQGQIIELEPGGTETTRFQIPTSQTVGLTLIGVPINAELRDGDSFIDSAHAATDWTPLGTATLVSKDTEATTWTLSLDNPSNEPVTLQIALWVLDGVYQIDADINTDDERSIIEASVAGRDSAQPGADPNILLYPLNNREVRIEAALRDDGTGGDTVAGDGMYGRSIPSLSPGDYFGTVTIVVDDTEIVKNVFFRVDAE